MMVKVGETCSSKDLITLRYFVSFPYVLRESVFMHRVAATHFVNLHSDVYIAYSDAHIAYSDVNIAYRDVSTVHSDVHIVCCKSVLYVYLKV